MSNSRPMLDANGEPVKCATCGAQCYCDPIWYSGQPQRCDACIRAELVARYEATGERHPNLRVLA